MSVMARRIVVLVAVFLSGCATTKVTHDALEPGERDALIRQTVIVVRRPLPDFQIYKTSDQYLQMATAPFGLAAIWGTFGALVAAAPGRSDAFRDEHRLSDPAHSVAAELGRYFSSRYDVVFAGLTDATLETPDALDVAAALNGRAQFALDVRTGYWGLTTNPYVAKYRFGYRASMQLIAVESGTVVASGNCAHSMALGEAEGLDELTANGARLLKERIGSAARSCAADFTAAILEARNPAE